MDASSTPPALELKLAAKILVLQERGVNDGSGQDSKETNPGAPSACESVQMGHCWPAESRVLFRQLGHRGSTKHGRAPTAHPARAARQGEAQSKWFLGNSEICTAR